MTIPSYQTLMLPLLRLAAQGEVAFQDAVETLAKEFQLTPEEAAQRLPGGQRVIYNRTGWAKVELVKAGLVEQPKRGSFKITQRGVETSWPRRRLPSPETSFTSAILSFASSSRLPSIVRTTVQA